MQQPRLVLVLFLLACPARLWADTLACPIVETLQDGEFQRSAQIQTTPSLYEALAAETGAAPGATPWTEETEISVLPTGANQLRLVIPPWALLSVGLRNAILTTGCSVVPADYGTFAREPRRVGDLLTYDQTDTTRPVIHPWYHGQPPNPWTGARWRPRWMAAVRHWLLPPLAWALSNAPMTPVVETCPSAQDPLAGGWSSVQLLGGATLMSVPPAASSRSAPPMGASRGA